MNHFLQTLKEGFLISNHNLASINSAVHTATTRNGRNVMFEIISLLCLITAIVLLIILSIIDLKILILPDELNFSLGVAGVIFHLVTATIFLDGIDMLAGAALGAGMLYVIRFFANRVYDRDTLGLGDVKLLGAAGIWLGPEMVLIAVTLGAFAGLIHGIFYAGWIAHKTKTKFTVQDLTIPAGPGFAIGIVLAGGYMFIPYVLETLNDLFA